MLTFQKAVFSVKSRWTTNSSAFAGYTIRPMTVSISTTSMTLKTNWALYTIKGTIVSCAETLTFRPQTGILCGATVRKKTKSLNYWIPLFLAKTRKSDLLSQLIGCRFMQKYCPLCWSGWKIQQILWLFWSCSNQIAMSFETVWIN